MDMKYAFMLLLMIAVTAISNAQTDIQLYQQLASPTHSYKALSGWHGGVQAGLNYQNLWPGIASSNTGYLLNADIYSEKIHAAFGINAGHQRQNNGLLNTNVVETYFSPKFKLKNGLTLMPSTALSINQRSLAWDMISSGSNTYLPFVYDPTQSITNQNSNWIGVGLGFGMNYKNWFAVIDFATINQPNIGFYKNTEERKPIRSSFIIGRSINLGDFGLMPTISYAREGSFNTLKMAMNANYKWLMIAAAYDWDNAFATSIGILVKNKVRFSYSYVSPTSSLASSAVSHEIGLSVIFAKPERGFIKNMGLM